MCTRVDEWASICISGSHNRRIVTDKIKFGHGIVGNLKLINVHTIERGCIAYGSYLFMCRKTEKNARTLLYPWKGYNIRVRACPQGNVLRLHLRGR